MTKDSDYEPLNITCIFSPPAEGNKDVQQIQEDLPQERFDNQQEPDKKKRLSRRLFPIITNNTGRIIQLQNSMLIIRMFKGA